MRWPGRPPVPGAGLAAIAAAAVLAMSACGSSGSPGASRLPGPTGPPVAHGRVLHVAESGSNSARGSRARPWRTLRRAAASVRPGDTVLIHQGTYGARGRTIRIRRGGREGRPVVFRGARENRRPRILGHVRVDASHVRLERLLLDGPTGRVLAPSGENPGGEEVQIWISGDDVALQHSEIRNNLWHAGVFVTGDRALLTRNHIHHNGDFEDPARVNLDHGIYWAEGSGGLIADNLVDHNRAYGVHLYPKPEGLAVLHNTLVHNGRNGLVLAEETADVRVANNIVAFNGSELLTFDLQGGGNVVANNLFWRNGSGALPDGLDLQSEANLIADPLFAGPGDYRLRPDSPAAGRADPGSWTPMDLTGRARPLTRRTDLGAFESRRP